MTDTAPVRRSARVAAATAKRAPEDIKPTAAAPKKSKASKAKPKEEKDEVPESKVETKEETEDAKKEVEEEVKEKSGPLAVGDEVPDITLLDQDSNEIKLAEVAKSSKYIVIFAYPKANTPGCTRQACAYRDHYNEFTSSDVTVFGLSADSPNAQKSFETKHNLPYKLLSDTKYELIGLLGAKKTASGGVTRSHWVIKDGKFVSVNVGVKPDDSWSKTFAEVKKSSD